MSEEEMPDLETINPNSQNEDGKTSLHLAIEEGDLVLAQHLVDEDGVILDIQDNDGKTPLHYAIKGGYLGLTKSIVSYSEYINLNEKDSDGKTPLHYAANDPSEAFTKLLLGSGANPNEIDKDGNTPLIVAILAKYGIPAIELVKGGSDLDMVNNEGQAAIDIALRDVEGNQGLILEMITSKRMSEGLLKRVVPKCIEFYMNQNLEQLMDFIDSGIDPDVDVPSQDNGLLHMVADSDDYGYRALDGSRSKEQIFYALVRAGADINRKNSDGFTPLDVALMSGNGAITFELLRLGAIVEEGAVSSKDATKLRRVIYTSLMDSPEHLMDLIDQKDRAKFVYTKDGVKVFVEGEEFASMDPDHPLKRIIEKLCSDHIRVLGGQSKRDLGPESKLSLALERGASSLAIEGPSAEGRASGETAIAAAAAPASQQVAIGTNSVASSLFGVSSDEVSDAVLEGGELGFASIMIGARQRDMNEDIGFFIPPKPPKVQSFKGQYLGTFSELADNILAQIYFKIQREAVKVMYRGIQDVIKLIPTDEGKYNYSYEESRKSITQINEVSFKIAKIITCRVLENQGKMRNLSELAINVNNEVLILKSRNPDSDISTMDVAAILVNVSKNEILEKAKFEIDIDEALGDLGLVNEELSEEEIKEIIEDVLKDANVLNSSYAFLSCADDVDKRSNEYPRVFRNYLDPIKFAQDVLTLDPKDEEGLLETLRDLNDQQLTNAIKSSANAIVEPVNYYLQLELKVILELIIHLAPEVKIERLDEKKAILQVDLNDLRAQVNSLALDRRDLLAIKDKSGEGTVAPTEESQEERQVMRVEDIDKAIANIRKDVTIAQRRINEIDNEKRHASSERVEAMDSTTSRVSQDRSRLGINDENPGNSPLRKGEYNGHVHAVRSLVSLDRNSRDGGVF